MSSSGAPAVRPASREIARAAVQAELSLAAYELVVEKGYGNVTLDDMAAAGGVSRSTFLRYFRTKDQAIQVALKAYVQRMADALRARPREEDDWSALRSARLATSLATTLVLLCHCSACGFHTYCHWLIAVR